jgi:hypothetical protein
MPESQEPPAGSNRQKQIDQRSKPVNIVPEQPTIQKIERKDEIRQRSFYEEMMTLINQHCQETVSNTPDYILATYFMACLEAFNHATQERDRWYSIEPKPGWEGKREEK